MTFEMHDWWQVSSKRQKMARWWVLSWWRGMGKGSEMQKHKAHLETKSGRYKQLRGRRSNQSILKEINLNIHWKYWCWRSNTLGTWCEQPPHCKRPWCWERLRAREGGDRGWDGWMASPTQWTWLWANSERWWRTGKPGMLQSVGLQRVGHDLATEQQQMKICN